MCGRYAQTLPPDIVHRIFGTAGPLPNAQPSWNVAPTSRSMVVRIDDDGQRRIDLMRWGLVPIWAKDVKIGVRAINARSEDAATKPMFRDALKKRRCLIPVDAFYEWKAAGDVKQPYAIGRADGTPLALAGAWERWTEPGGAEPLLSFTILTCTPNETMAAVHNRMPVILAPESWPAWLGETPATEIAGLMKPCPSEWLRVWPVSTRVNAVRNNDATLIEPIAA